MFEGNGIRGLEQNPATKSRWAQIARSGKKVMQFLENGRYVCKRRRWKCAVVRRRGKGASFKRFVGLGTVSGLRGLCDPQNKLWFLASLTA